MTVLTPHSGINLGDQGIRTPLEVLRAGQERLRAGGERLSAYGHQVLELTGIAAADRYMHRNTVPTIRVGGARPRIGYDTYALREDLPPEVDINTATASDYAYGLVRERIALSNGSRAVESPAAVDHDPYVLRRVRTEPTARNYNIVTDPNPFRRLRGIGRTALGYARRSGKIGRHSGNRPDTFDDLRPNPVLREPKHRR